MELGPPVSESSTKSQNFMPPTDFELKFYKTRIENWLPIGFNLGERLDWEPAVITTTNYVQLLTGIVLRLYIPIR